MKSFLIKTIIFSVIFVLFFNMPLKPLNKAEAFACVNCSQWVIDVVHFAEEAAYWVWDAMRWMEEKLGLKFRDLIAKRIIDYIVDQIIVWIQGGGQPKFVTDWEGFAKQIFNEAVGEIVYNTDFRFLCSPFRFQVAVSLLPVQRFQHRVNCTLDQIVSNIENFYNDFRNGGWIAYNEMWQPQNNYYGQMLMFHDEMAIAAAKKQTAALNEAAAGSGFLGVTKCSGVSYTIDEMQEVTRGDLTGYARDSEDRYCPNNELKTVTPGDTVGKAVARAITSDIEWAANIQSWMAALVNAVINRLTREGIGLATMALSSDASDEYFPSDIPGYEEFVSSSFAGNRELMIGNINKVLNEWTYLKSKKESSLSYTRNLLNVLQQMQENGCRWEEYETVGDTYFVTERNIGAMIRQNESDETRLRGEIRDLDYKIGIAVNLITQINTATNDSQLSSIYPSYSQFLTQYYTPDVLVQIATGEARTAANQELESKERLYNTASNILNQCLLGQGRPIQPQPPNGTWGPADIPICSSVEDVLALCTAAGCLEYDLPGELRGWSIAGGPEWSCFGGTNCLTTAYLIKCTLMCGQQLQDRYIHCSPTGCEVNCRNTGQYCVAGETVCRY